MLPGYPFLGAPVLVDIEKRRRDLLDSIEDLLIIMTCILIVGSTTLVFHGAQVGLDIGGISCPKEE